MRSARTSPLTAGVTGANGLWYVGSHLLIPQTGNVREQLYRLVHDAAGHFGFDKSYALLRHNYYWPNMRWDLEEAYVPACVQCQWNKSSTKVPTGPLHPLPVPDKRGDSVTLDFIGPLPPDKGYNCIMMMTDRLGGADICIVVVKYDMTMEELAVVFFNNWYCENGLPLEIVSDQDKLFISAFWHALHKLTGVKLQMSSSYHPQTDGASEQTNKTVNQVLIYHVQHNQKG